MAAEPSADASEAWARIHELLEDGNLDEALAEAERFVEKEPGSAEGRAMVGIVLAQAGENERALTFLDQALVLEPGLTRAAIEKGRVLYEDGRYEDVLDTLGGIETAEALYLVSAALYELGEHEEAESACARALGRDEFSELRQLEAFLKLQGAENEGAVSSARRAIELEPDSADAHHSLGLAYTQLGSLSEADAAFARAEELDPDGYFRPCRLTEDEFEEVVDEALSQIPDEFEAFLENVEVGIEDVPDPNLVREGLEFDLLGIYQGHTIQSLGWDLPDRVLLFQRNLENISPDRATLMREIRDTVFHEVGHHMGMDEDAVQNAEDWTHDEEDEEEV